MGHVPTSVCLTSHELVRSSGIRTPLQELVNQIEAGTLQASVAKTFRLDGIVEAHRMMEENRAGGKIVLLM